MLCVVHQVFAEVEPFDARWNQRDLRELVLPQVKRVQPAQVVHLQDLQLVPAEVQISESVYSPEVYFSDTVVRRSQLGQVRLLLAVQPR